MWSHPALRELLWQAFVGARGWLLGCAVLGFTLLGGSFALLGSPEPRAVALAFFVPLLLAAIMGSTSLSAYRARHEYGARPAFAVRVFLAAALWNAFLAALALVLDRAVVHYGLLMRPPFPFPASVGFAAMAAATVALLSVYPRRGPQ
jgi:hypothetical protein